MEALLAPETSTSTVEENHKAATTSTATTKKSKTDDDTNHKINRKQCVKNNSKSLVNKASVGREGAKSTIVKSNNPQGQHVKDQHRTSSSSLSVLANGSNCHSNSNSPFSKLESDNEDVEKWKQTFSKIMARSYKNNPCVVSAATTSSSNYAANNNNSKK